ncbi:MAG TPA: cation transporter [Saprospiraceae bacterium]|nr:cation transporter [Saprospiraceae bacterium]HNT20649.1 cation transporter [Saprospiraceae bacterium]
MTQTYTVTGMTCGSCELAVKNALQSLPHVKSAEVSKTAQQAKLELEKAIPLSELQQALGPNKYKITPHPSAHEATPEKSWIQTYKPILLVFANLLGLTLFIEAYRGSFGWMRWMNHFMAGFFLVFSFFKLLDLKGFAESYARYDILAKRWAPWGYVYAFVELGLGLLYLGGWFPLVTNTITFAVMSLSLVGVLQTVLNKRVIQCACLGKVFDLPMSTVTIAEDALMIGMSLIMLLYMI